MKPAPDFAQPHIRSSGLLHEIGSIPDPSFLPTEASRQTRNGAFLGTAQVVARSRKSLGKVVGLRTVSADERCTKKGGPKQGCPHAHTYAYSKTNSYGGEIPDVKWFMPRSHRNPSGEISGDFPAEKWRIDPRGAHKQTPIARLLITDRYLDLLLATGPKHPHQHRLFALPLVLRSLILRTWAACYLA